MAVTCNLVAVDNPDPSLIRVPAGHIPNFPEYEPACAEHWIFDKAGAGNLIGLKAGLSLTPVGAGALAPVHSDKYLTLPGGGLSGLLTPFDDVAGPFTLCLVARYSVLNASGLFLSSSTLASSTAGGENCLLNSAGVLRLNVMTASGQQQRDMTGVVEANKPFFMVLSAPVGGRVIARAVANSLLAATNLAATKLLATPMRKLGIGNCYRANTGYVENPLDMMEAIYFPTARSQTQNVGTYNNSKARMTKRGFTLA